MIIPLNRLRIEWNHSLLGGGLRLSDVEHDAPDRKFRYSAGACFGAWRQLSCNDPRLEVWLWTTLFAVLEKGVDQSMLFDKLNEAIECPPILWSLPDGPETLEADWKASFD